MPIHHTSKILLAGFPDIHTNYEQALLQSGFLVDYPNTSLDDMPYILSSLITSDYDLLLLPGGGDISPLLYTRSDTCNISPDYITDLLQFQLLQSALINQKPILGICKGMQLLNVYFGGSLHAHLPTAEMHEYNSGDRMHPLSFALHFPEHCSIWGKDIRSAASLYELLSSCTVVNSAHHQGIKKLGRDFLTLQFSEDFLPETIAHRHLPILGLQWHPERLPGFKENTFGTLVHLLLQSAQL